MQKKVITEVPNIAMPLNEKSLKDLENNIPSNQLPVLSGQRAAVSTEPSRAISIAQLKEKYITLYSPQNCLSHVGKIHSTLEAVNRKAPTISSFKRECGEDFQCSLIKVWLVYLNNILGISRPMSEDQIRLCATQIIDDFGYLRMSELSYLFKRIISGEFGEFYESLTIAKVLTFFREYDKERTEVVIEEREREHEAFRYKENNTDTLKDIYKRRLKKLYPA